MVNVSKNEKVNRRKENKKLRSLLEPHRPVTLSTESAAVRHSDNITQEVFRILDFTFEAVIQASIRLTTTITLKDS